MEEHHIVIDTLQGQLRGQEKQSIFSSRKYYTFKGIPYAKPPLGELRFKAPEPFGCWEGIRDALTDGNYCKQHKPLYMIKLEKNPTEFSIGDEDCLYLNVSVNKILEGTASRLPVMVYIHSGGLESGTGNSVLCGPDYFMEEDVVLVSINYRCGVFGFLSLESEDVPGNAGLKDQTLALQWVHDNIYSFGGDPNNVTIFGNSAGGASVQFHMLSPLSKGLFHKAIIQSGSALNPWALQLEPLKNAACLAKALGFSSEEPDELLTYLQSVSATDLILAKKKMVQSQDFCVPLDLIFTACVETSGTKPFLPDFPQKLMEAGRFHNVPVIQGVMMNEGSVIPACNYLTAELIERQNRNPTRFVMPMVRFPHGSDEEKEVCKAITDFYFKGKALSWDNVNDYMPFLSDIIVNIGMERSRNSLLKMSNSAVYSYLFTNHKRCTCHVFQTDLKNEELFSKLFSGTCHGSEFLYMFVIYLNDSIKTPAITPDDRRDIEKFIKSWTTFASVGDPNHEGMETVWEKDSVNDPCYIDLGEHWSMKRGIPFEDRIHVWNQLRANNLIL